MTSQTTSLATRAPVAVLLATAGVTYALASLATSIGRTPGEIYYTPLPVLIIHLATVIPAVPLGAYVLWSRKGDAMHKRLGRVWAAMMLITAIDSFWVRGMTGAIGPIHFFSAVTLVSIPLAIYHIRNGNIAAHKRAMTFTYIGLCVAGLYAMVPGRLVGSFLFG